MIEVDTVQYFASFRLLAVVLTVMAYSWSNNDAPISPQSSISRMAIWVPFPSEVILLSVEMTLLVA